MYEPFPEVRASALQHIDIHGSLVRHSPDRAERLVLMKALSKQGFVAWNKKLGKYHLTAFGRKQHDQDRKHETTCRPLTSWRADAVIE
jgi:hypothetical protein